MTSVLFLSLFLGVFILPIEESGSNEYSFGENIEVGSNVPTKRFVFTKSPDGNSASSVVLESIDGAFYLVSKTSCDRELKKAADKCYVTIKFMKSNLPGSYQGTLLVGEEGNYNTIELRASVAEPDTSNALVLYEGSEAVSSLSYGNLEAKATLTKTLTLKNEGIVALPVTVSLSGDAAYIKNTDTCNGKTLGINKTCSIKLTLKAPTTAPAEDENKYADLQINEGSISAEGMIVGTGTISALADVKLYEGSEEKTTIDYGLVAQNKTVTKTLVLKNEGSGPSNTLDISFEVVSSSCGCYKKFCVKYSS